MSTDEAEKAAADLGDLQPEPALPPEPPREAPAPSLALPSLALPAPAQGSALTRVFRWFWPKDAQVPAHDATYLALVDRARAAADVAQRAEASAEPFQSDVSPVIAELYRQSIHWSLRALAGATDAAPTDAAWSSLNPELVQRALPEPELRARVESALSAGFEYLAWLSATDRTALLVGLRRLALALVHEIGLDQRAAEAIWVQRGVRIGLLVVLFGIIGLVTLKGLDSAERGRDLAAGASWRASSAYSGAAGCHSPAQECSESPEYFFHTNEEQSPWVEFDLTTAQRISGVRVENRADCCVDRVAPMIVEVSTDQQHWQKVARRDTTFAVWSTSFTPVSARYVRLRLEKRESLHLRGVRILRAN